MREIKFRVWDRLKREMVIYDDQAEGVTPMQFTGISDSNGRDVYEGDILRTDDFVDYDGKPYYVHTKVFWSEEFMGWMVLDIAKTDEPSSKIQEMPLCVYVNDVKFEVVGNIYEHTGGKLK